MVKCLLCFCAVLCSINSLAQTIIEGRITDQKDTSAGISYAAILGTTNKQIGTISNKEGYFRLNIPANEDSLNLTISVLGYRDSIVGVRRPWKFLDIKLSEQPLVLEEINVNAGELVDLRLGSPDLLFIGKKDSTFKTVMADQAGASVGIFVDLGRKKIILNSLSLSLNPSVAFPVEYIAQFYGLDKKPEYYRLTPKSELVPLTSEPLKFTSKGPGWLTIDLSSNNINCDYRFIIIALSKYKEYYWDTPRTNELFDYHLLTQVGQSKKISHFYIFGEKFAILRPSDGIPAIFADTYTEKNR